MSQQNRVTLKLHEGCKICMDTVELKIKGKLYGIPYIVSNPGAGKSALLKQMAHERGYGFLSYELGLERPEKFGGIPDMKYKEVKKLPFQQFFNVPKINEVLGTNFINTSKILLNKNQQELLKNYYENEPEVKSLLYTRWSIPQMVDEVWEASKKFKIVVILLDDWHTCDEYLQQLGYEAFTYHSISGYKLPENSVFILAGNETSACGAKVQLAAIRNRCMIMYVESCPEYWLKNFAYKHHIFGPGISFFEQKANWDIFHESESTTTQFGSPRQWTSVFNYLEFLETKYPNKEIPQDICLSIIQAGVSQTAAHRFGLFYQIYRKMNIKELYDQNIINIPDNDMDKFAYSSVATEEFYNRFHDEDLRVNASKSYISFLNEISIKRNKPELALTSISSLLKRPKSDELKLQSGEDTIRYLYENSMVPTSLMNIFRKSAACLNQ